MFEKMFTLVVFILAVLKIPTSAILLFDSCPDVTVVTNFDIQQYAGKWYEEARFYTQILKRVKCVRSEYYTLDDNRTIHIETQEIQTYGGTQRSMNGTARLASTTGEGKLIVNIPSSPTQSDAPYWVLGTDYDTYSVVWSCVDIGSHNLQNAWILTREIPPSTSTLEAVDRVLEEQHIPKSYFFKTDQNCPQTE